MSERLIDDFDSLNRTESTNRLVKIVVILSTLLFLILSLLYSFQIHILLGKYYEFRHKIVDVIRTNSIINVVSISLIPYLAYHVWIKKASLVKIRSYLLLLFFAIVLFIGFIVLGLELILQTALDYSNSNPLLPTYMLTARFPYSFILLFIFSATMSFLTLKLIFRKSIAK
jgi:hypothetical protein